MWDVSAGCSCPRMTVRSSRAGKGVRDGAVTRWYYPICHGWPAKLRQWQWINKKWRIDPCNSLWQETILSWLGRKTNRMEMFTECASSPESLDDVRGDSRSAFMCVRLPGQGHAVTGHISYDGLLGWTGQLVWLWNRGYREAATLCKDKIRI